MKQTPLLLLFLLVVLPLGLLTWMGVRLAGHERQLVEDQIRELLTARLYDIDRQLGDQLELLAADLQDVTTVDTFSRDELRNVVQNDPRIFQIFVQAPDGALLYPDPAGPLITSERDFILRASSILNDRLLIKAAEQEIAPPPALQNSASPIQRTQPTPNSPIQGQSSAAPTEISLSRSGRASRWFVWYWGPGMNLLYWQQRPSGHIVGAALDRSRWIADLIASLPDTPGGPDKSLANLADSSFQLVESGANPIYQWGSYEPEGSEPPACEIRLSPPLAAWQLQQHASPQVLHVNSGRGAYFNVFLGLAVSGAGVIALAWAFYQNYARDMREAGRRVSFVNQVSHELRTPLTNIRMYAELLAGDLERIEIKEQSLHDRLEVIVAESQRLSRLIGNVLTFARHEKKTLSIQPQPLVVDQLVKDTVENFRPALEHRNILTQLSLEAAAIVQIDPDALEQILGNLLSNVEKYAACGGWVEVRTSQTPEQTTIMVTDRGPGIPAGAQEKVFDPYWRGSHDVSQAAGTGIGLTIARELARRHGGDVIVAEHHPGARFIVTLATPHNSQHNSQSDV